MVSNNKYYKLIAEFLNDEEYDDFHNDVYYLKRIVGHYDSSYLTAKIKCKGKYLKEFYKNHSYVLILSNKNC